MAVYLVQAGGDGPIKIGHAANPSRRIASLATACPYELTTLAVLEGGKSLERALHERFAAHRLRGEWFDPHEDVISFCREPDEIAVQEDELLDFPIIAKAGGDDVALKYVQFHSLRMMRARGRLTSKLMRALMAEADRQGVKYCATDFLPAAL